MSQHDSDEMKSSTPPTPGSAQPPDRASGGGDVSTTGESAQDVKRHEASGNDAHGEAPDAHAGHGTTTGHGGHGGHGDDDASERSTLVDVSWRQLIWPALIILLVAILLIGPVSNAFAPRPAAPTGTEEQVGEGAGEAGEGAETTPTDAEPSPTPHSIVTPTEAVAIAPSATATVPAPVAIPREGTQTAVALAGEQGEVARVPEKLEFAGASFTIQPGTGLLPDWKPDQPETTATWIEGTVANHILYVPYSAQNEALFKVAKAGDIVKVQMNTGQVFEFAITRSERAANGPPTSEGQFSVSTAMAQDHAGVTLFLTGDPAADRAVVMADFTGDIQ